MVSLVRGVVMGGGVQTRGVGGDRGRDITIERGRKSRWHGGWMAELCKLDGDLDCLQEQT